MLFMSYHEEYKVLSCHVVNRVKCYHVMFELDLVLAIRATVGAGETIRGLICFIIDSAVGERTAQLLLS